jgi:hypothetical protein
MMNGIALTFLISAVIPGPLQAQVDATPPGGTLLLPPGEHSGPVVLRRPIHIKGSGLEHTKLVDDVGTLIVVTGKAGKVTLEGLSMRGPEKLAMGNGGTFLYGGALRIEAGAEVAAIDVLFKGSRGAQIGGAISVRGTLRGERVRIEGNYALFGGGALDASEDAIVELVDSTIVGNSSEGPPQIVFNGRTLILRRVVIRDPKSAVWPNGRQLSLYANPKGGPPQVLLDNVTIGVVNTGSSISITENEDGTPSVTLIDTEWPKSAKVPEGWAPIIANRSAER